MDKKQKQDLEREEHEMPYTLLGEKLAVPVFGARESEQEGFVKIIVTGLVRAKDISKLGYGDVDVGLVSKKQKREYELGLVSAVELVEDVHNCDGELSVGFDYHPKGHEMHNLYYYPEKCGIEIIAEIDPEEAYEFDTLLVFRVIGTGEIKWAHDTGCSCPTPFEGMGIDDLRDLELDDPDWRREVENQMHRGNTGDVQAFLRKVEEALKNKRASRDENEG
jgi:hypothetical protein